MQKRITIEVCLPVLVEAMVSLTEDGETVVHSGQIRGASYDGDRWLCEHMSEADFEELDRKAQAACEVSA